MLLKSVNVRLDNEAAVDSSRMKTILLVEDEERVREVMEATLSLSGYHVLSTGSALEAREIIESHDATIHLMVTDFAMPYMNGAELAAHLKRARPEAKVLYVSGFPRQDLQELHDKSGRILPEFMQKPFTPEDLEVKVQDILSEAD
jgi:two-component system, cell cycle sensor histidine kinase and response regulator CckA